MLSVVRECVRQPLEGRGNRRDTMRAVTAYWMDYGGNTDIAPTSLWFHQGIFLQSLKIITNGRNTTHGAD